MAGDLTEVPEYRYTMDRLEAIKRQTSTGADYWTAREIHAVLGYPVWDKFEPVIERASTSFATNGIDHTHHIAQTSKMVEVGSGGQRRVADFFLSRAACYLIAMNGDPGKPEIAAAQAYFAVQTRRAELRDQDEKRVELRGKVAQSFRRVSGIAKEAGVRSDMQAIFHDARYHGLYAMSSREVKRRKGLTTKDNLFDHAGPLELSANEFQMNLAADVIVRENVKGHSEVITKNKEIGQRVRRTMKESGSVLPEDLPLAGPIKEVKRRLAQKKKDSDPKN